MNFTDINNILRRFVRDNSPALLAGTAITGVAATAYLSGKASYHLALYIDVEYEGNPPPRKIDQLRLFWKRYIPTVVAGVTTSACVIGATKIGNRRTAAAVAAYSLTERAFTEYKEKVVEKFGENKEQQVRDEIAQDRIKNQQVPQAVIVANGTVLCYEMHTGRYFLSDMEHLRKTQNDINAKLLREMYATLSDFYYALGIDYTQSSSDIGWTSDKPLELRFSTVLSPDGRPCLAFEYNYVKVL